MITRERAYEILQEMTETPSLLRHARSVSIVMEALAKHFGENSEQYAVTGLLHDADYEKFPDQHPNVIVKRLEEMGEEAIAHAIKGHYTKWEVPRNSLLDKSIVAADELTGFIIAASLIRPTKIEGMTADSVIKKLKTKGFAATVDREEVQKGAELLDWDLKQLIDFIIAALNEHQEELELI